MGRPDLGGRTVPGTVPAHSGNVGRGECPAGRVAEGESAGPEIGESAGFGIDPILRTAQIHDCIKTMHAFIAVWSVVFIDRCQQL